MKEKLTADARRWRAEADAHTMSAYEEIMSDKSRMKAAQSFARQEAMRLRKAADTMGRVSKGGKKR